MNHLKKKVLYSSCATCRIFSGNQAFEKKRFLSYGEQIEINITIHPPPSVSMSQNTVTWPMTGSSTAYSPLTTPGCDLCIPVQSMGPLSSVTKSIKENVNKNEGRLSHLLHKCTFCLNKPFRVLVLWIIVIRVANALFNTKLKNFAVVVLKSRRRMCMESSGLILI